MDIRLDYIYNFKIIHIEEMDFTSISENLNFLSWTDPIPVKLQKIHSIRLTDVYV